MCLVTFIFIIMQRTLYKEINEFLRQKYTYSTHLDHVSSWSEGKFWKSFLAEKFCTLTDITNKWHVSRIHAYEKFTDLNLSIIRKSFTINHIKKIIIIKKSDFQFGELSTAQSPLLQKDHNTQHFSWNHPCTVTKPLVEDHDSDVHVLVSQR